MKIHFISQTFIEFILFLFQSFMNILHGYKLVRLAYVVLFLLSLRLNLSWIYLGSSKIFEIVVGEATI